MIGTLHLGSNLKRYFNTKAVNENAAPPPTHIHVCRVLKEPFFVTRRMLKERMGVQSMNHMLKMFSKVSYMWMNLKESLQQLGRIVNGEEKSSRQSLCEWMAWFT